MLNKQTWLQALIVTGIVGTISVPSAQAAIVRMNANSVQFNTTDIQVYTGGSSGQFILNNNAINPAINLLTNPNNNYANVELWRSTENPLANVGFSGILGGKNVSVSSVTAADWQNGLGTQWLNDFLTAYNGRGITVSGNNVTVGAITQTKTQLLTSLLAANGLPSSGDPNISSFTLDTDTNTFSLDLIGHKDLKPRLLAGQYSTGNAAWDQLLRGAATQITGELQASEIAKVTIGNQSYFAYSFNAQSTGITTPDGTESYTGKYTWNKTLPLPVPESSTIFGLIGLGGILVLTQKKR